MKIALFIPAYNRVEILKQCLNSVKAANLSFDGEQIEKHVFCDKCAFQSEIKELAADWGAQVHLAKDRLYADRNTIRAYKKLFDDGVDIVIRLDSDLVITQGAISALLQAHHYANRFASHIVHTSITTVGNVAWKKAMSGAVIHGFTSGTNLVLDRHCWEMIGPLMLEYDTLFLGGDPVTRDNPAARAWIKNKIAPAQKLPDYAWESHYFGCGGTGNDAVTQVCCAAAGVRCAFLVVNRAITISPVGENTTPELYAAFNSVVLDALPGDQSLRNFWWYPYSL